MKKDCTWRKLGKETEGGESVVSAFVQQGEPTASARARGRPGRIMQRRGRMLGPVTVRPAGADAGPSPGR